MTLFWIVLAAGFVIAIWSNHVKQTAKDAAKQQYGAALAQLKKEPSSPDQRQITLELGRVYSNLMRDKKGNTVFDEVALMNDINAACAAAQVISPSSKETAPQGPEERLKKLQDLRTMGLIDETEYAERRREI